MLGFCAYRLFYDVAILQNHQRRDRHDPVAVCQFRLFVDIDFADLDVLPLFCDLVQDGTYHTAGSAPACEEVQKHRLVGIQNFLMEIVFVDVKYLHNLFLLEVRLFFFCDYSIPQKETFFCDKLTLAEYFSKRKSKQKSFCLLFV